MIAIRDANVNSKYDQGKVQEVISDDGPVRIPCKHSARHAIQAIRGQAVGTECTVNTRCDFYSGEIENISRGRSQAPSGMRNLRRSAYFLFDRSILRNSSDFYVSNTAN